MIERIEKENYNCCKEREEHMAKYIVIDKKTEIYEPEVKLAFLNLLAGVIWAIPFIQKVFPDVNGFIGLAIGFVFTVVYIIISFVPVIAIVPCVGAGIIYTTMLWGFADGIGHDVWRIILKIIILLLVIFIEFVVFGNATLKWAQLKFSEPPRIIRVEEGDSKE